MRLSVGILLVANVTLALWGLYHYEAPVAQPRPPVNPGALRLLAAGGEAGSPLADDCFAIGPFPAREKVDQAEALLRERGVPYTVGAVQGTSVAGYRVSAGPFENREAARRMQERLNAMGETGHYLVRGENSQFSVALAFFQGLPGAEAYLRRLAGKGLQAALEPRTLAAGQVFWLNLGSVRGAGKSVRGLATAEFGAEISLQARPCRSLGG
ncbi:MAG: SPOR domain-containing protein [Gammaproteobacteria bacterium]|jgi:hypothetical protein|nr:SPOR domain-containing protein [Gammaproteobacteria bacterium]